MSKCFATVNCCNKYCTVGAVPLQKYCLPSQTLFTVHNVNFCSNNKLASQTFNLVSRGTWHMLIICDFGVHALV